MIEYDKRQWSAHLFDVEGSMVREIIGRVGATVAWAAIVVALHHTVWSIQVSPTIHTLVGAALGLLLVFRTNASYDRYWEGRKQWGSIINESRNLARGARSYLRPSAPDLADRIGVLTVAFAHATMHALRDTAPVDRVLGTLDDDVSAAALASPHPPTAISGRITDRLAEARDRGAISEYMMVNLDRNVQQLIDYLGACERIRKTPLPFVYVVHLRRALILYCFTLPLALVQYYGWWTILATLLTSYTFFGIEEIGVEIENPFGRDANDLPLEQFCETIARDVRSLLEAGPEDGALAPAGVVTARA